MSYSIENINGCTKKIIFNFETLDLSKEIKEAIIKKQRDTNLKGFRKGKAPLEMVKKLYGGQIEAEALDNFVRENFFEVISKENLQMVGHPKFENMKYVAGESVSFDALVEVFPTLELKDMSDLTFNKDKVDVTDEELEGLKKNYLNSKAEVVEIKDENVLLEKGHLAVINFQGIRKDGSRPENMKASEHVLEVGSGQFIPGFEDAIIGMKKGDKRDIDLKFPKEYHQEDLQNEDVKFEVELLEIKEKKLPEFNDELSKEFGFESVKDFEDKGRNNILMQKNKQVEEKLHQEILEKLVEINNFDVPTALVERQKEFIKEEVKKTLERQNFNEQMMEEYFIKWKDDLESKALFQVKSGLILDKIARDNDIETTEDDLDKKIDEMAKSTGLEKDKVKKYYVSDEKIKNNLMYSIREEKTFDVLKENLKILMAE